MIDLSLERIAELRADLRLFILLCLLGAFLAPWLAFVYDGIKGRLK